MGSIPIDNPLATNDIYLEKILDWYESFGLIMNRKKSFFSRHPHFLEQYYDNNINNFYNNDCKILQSLSKTILLPTVLEIKTVISNTLLNMDLKLKKKCYDIIILIHKYRGFVIHESELNRSLHLLGYRGGKFSHLEIYSDLDMNLEKSNIKCMLKFQKAQHKWKIAALKDSFICEHKNRNKLGNFLQKFESSIFEEISKAMIYFDIKKFKTLDYFKYLEEMRKEKEYLSFVKYMELTRNKPCIIPKILDS